MRRALVLLALGGGLLAAAAAPAAAATHPGHGAAAASKPAPMPPAGIPVGSANVPKPHTTAHAGIRPMSPWSVTLSASPSTLWPTQFSTLTATASQDVGPTPEYIYINDLNTGATVAKCGTGSTCSVALTHNTPYFGDYYAYISDGTDTTGARAVASSPSKQVDWQGITLSLSASAHTTPVGSAVTLSATASQDIGPSPFFIEIWDTTTGTLLNTGPCGIGLNCPEASQAAITVSQSVATTHTFVATFGANSTSYPPAQLQTSSPVNYITWTNDGYQVSLSAPSIVTNGPTPVTVTANINVGPTPYYLEVFDETTGTRIAVFGTGSTQTFNYQVPRDSTDQLVAFISADDTALPPANIQASSATLAVSEVFIG